MIEIVGFVSEGVTEFNKPYVFNQGIKNINVISSGTISNVSYQDTVVQVNLIGFQSNQTLFSIPSGSTLQFKNTRIESISVPNNSYNKNVNTIQLILNFISVIDDNPPTPEVNLINTAYNPLPVIKDIAGTQLPFTVQQGATGYWKLDSVAFIPLTSTATPTNNYLRVANAGGTVIAEQGLVAWQENTTTLTFQASIYPYYFKDLILTTGDVISGNGIKGLRIHQISQYEVV